MIVKNQSMHSSLTVLPRVPHQPPQPIPVLLSFQELPIGGDLNVQGQLDVHQLLVLAHLAGHVLLGSLEGILQVSDAELGVPHCHLTALLSLCNLCFQGSPLEVEVIGIIKTYFIYY